MAVPDDSSSPQPGPSCSQSRVNLIPIMPSTRSRKKLSLPESPLSLPKSSSKNQGCEPKYVKETVILPFIDTNSHKECIPNIFERPLTRARKRHMDGGFETILHDHDPSKKQKMYK